MDSIDFDEIVLLGSPDELNPSPPPSSPSKSTRSQPSRKPTTARNSLTARDKAVTTLVPITGLRSSPTRRTPRKSPRKARRPSTPGPASASSQQQPVATTPPIDITTPRSSRKRPAPESPSKGTPRRESDRSITDVAGLSMSISLSEAEMPRLLEPARKRRGRRKEVTPILIATDSEQTENTGIDWLAASKKSPSPRKKASPAKKTPKNSSPSKNLRARKTSTPKKSSSPDRRSTRALSEAPPNPPEAPMSKTVHSLRQDDNHEEYADAPGVKFSPANKTPQKDEDRDGRSVSPSKAGPPQSILKPSRREPSEPPLSPSKRVSFANKTTGLSLSADDFGNTTTRFRELDSIFEGEAFSMIDTNSLPSVGPNSNARSTGFHPGSGSFNTNSEQPEDYSMMSIVEEEYISEPLAPQAEPQPALPTVQTTSTLPTPDASSELVNEPILSQRITSSSQPHKYTSMELHQGETPITSIEAIGPPPIQSPPTRAREMSARTASKSLSPAVRAGQSLQGLLHTASGGSSRLGSPFSSPAKSRSTLSPSPLQSIDPFQGFTQRSRLELDAGLRLGEELAEKDAAPTRRKISSTADIDDVFTNDSSADIHYPKVPSPEVQQNYRLAAPSAERVHFPDIQSREEQLPSPTETPDPNSADPNAIEWSAVPLTVITPGDHARARSHSRRLSEELEAASVEGDEDELGQLGEEAIEGEVYSEEEPVAEEYGYSEEEDNVEVATPEEEFSGDEENIETAAEGEEYSEEEDNIGDEYSYSNSDEPVQDAGQEAKWAAQRLATSRAIDSAPSDEVIVIDSSTVPLPETPNKDVHSASESESVPSSARALYRASSQNAAPALSRGKIPSPWRKTEPSSLIYSDELSTQLIRKHALPAPRRSPPGTKPRQDPTKPRAIIPFRRSVLPDAPRAPSSPPKALSPAPTLEPTTPRGRRTHRPFARSPTPPLLRYQYSPSNQPKPFPAPSPLTRHKVAPGNKWTLQHWDALEWAWRSSGLRTAPILPRIDPVCEYHEPIPVRDSLWLSYIDPNVGPNTKREEGDVRGGKIVNHQWEWTVEDAEVLVVELFREVVTDRAIEWDDWEVLARLFALVVDARDKRVARLVGRERRTEPRTEPVNLPRREKVSSRIVKASKEKSGKSERKAKKARLEGQPVPVVQEAIPQGRCVVM
ncbi:MAG: hypothetical protein M1814_005434 [Vezdaea aestivalis]|nr:MAG: hypothetical protein M1814_005434 [Vezdaea aestivalis]